MQAGGRAERQSNMELLRILAVAGVIVLHFNAKALPVAPPIGRHFLLLLELISACAVNVFVMLSGYFLWRRESVSVYKPLSLLIQLLIYRLVMHGIELALGSSEFTLEGMLILIMPLDYFLVLYCALYLLSPYLNRLLSLMEDRKLRRFLLLLLLVFSLWNALVDLLSTVTGLSLASSSTVGIKGAQEGYTIVNFILCYCVGAAIGRKSLVLPRPGLLFLGCLAAELLISRISLYLSIAYLSPIVICQAACALMLAERMRFQSRMVNFIASAALSVYMIHMHILARFEPASCAERSFFGILGYLAATVTVIYAVGLLAHCLYTAAASPIRKRLDERVRFPIISL